MFRALALFVTRSVRWMPKRNFVPSYVPRNMMEDNFVSLPPQRGTLCVNIVDDDDDDVLLCLFKWGAPVARLKEHSIKELLLFYTLVVHRGCLQGS